MNEVSRVKTNQASRLVPTLVWFVAGLVFGSIVFGDEASSQLPEAADAASGEAKNHSFQIKLDIQSGHIGHVFIGCQDEDDFNIPEIKQ